MLCYIISGIFFLLLHHIWNFLSYPCVINCLLYEVSIFGSEGSSIPHISRTAFWSFPAVFGRQWNQPHQQLSSQWWKGWWSWRASSPSHCSVLHACLLHVLQTDSRWKTSVFVMKCGILCHFYNSSWLFHCLRIYHMHDWKHTAPACFSPELGLHNHFWETKRMFRPEHWTIWSYCGAASWDKFAA